MQHRCKGHCADIWRRSEAKHCSSLCSQSEGHEHVANMTSALAHDFVGFSARAWPPQYSPPSLCEQSELQCFAPEFRRTLCICKDIKRPATFQLRAYARIVFFLLHENFLAILDVNSLLDFLNTTAAQIVDGGSLGFNGFVLVDAIGERAGFFQAPSVVVTKFAGVER